MQLLRMVSRAEHLSEYSLAVRLRVPASALPQLLRKLVHLQLVLCCLLLLSVSFRRFEQKPLQTHRNHRSTWKRSTF